MFARKHLTGQLGRRAARVDLDVGASDREFNLAYDAGRVAFDDGLPLVANPYSPSLACLAWWCGWWDAHNEIMPGPGQAQHQLDIEPDMRLVETLDRLGL